MTNEQAVEQAATGDASGPGVQGLLAQGAEIERRYRDGALDYEGYKQALAEHEAALAALPAPQSYEEAEQAYIDGLLSHEAFKEWREKHYEGRVDPLTRPPGMYIPDPEEPTQEQRFLASEEGQEWLAQRAETRRAAFAEAQQIQAHRGLYEPTVFKTLDEAEQAYVEEVIPHRVYRLYRAAFAGGE